MKTKYIKRKRLSVSVAAVCCILFAMLVSGCEMDIDRGVKNSRFCTGSVAVEGLSTKNYTVESMLESVGVGNNKFTVQLFDNELPQVLFVKNPAGEPIMMYRDLIPKKGEIEINAMTTAIGLLTFHPALGSAKGDEYAELVDLITSTEHFDSYLAAVEQSIANGMNIYDTTNQQLVEAGRSVFKELMGDTTRLFQVQDKAASPLTELYGCWPIDITQNGSTLNIRTPGCCPTYWCYVTDKGGNQVAKFAVPTRENYGVVNVFKCLIGKSDWKFGETVSYTFPGINTQRGFLFDRGGAEGRIDQYLQIGACILSMLGIDPIPKLIQDMAEIVGTAFTEISSYSTTGRLDIMAFAQVAFGKILDKLSDPKSNTYLANYIGYHAINIKQALTWVNLIEGGGNLILRVIWNCITETEYSFCSQYNMNRTFGLCSNETLRIIRGDQQEGRPNQQLNEPLVVCVESTGSWDELSGKNYRIRFIPREGCGAVYPSEVSMDEAHCASCVWTIGRRETTQHVDAILVDMDNRLNIDTVTFTASIDIRYLAYLEIVSGNDQTGTPGEQLDNPLTVEVTSDQVWDRLLDRNYRVAFVPAQGCGSFSNTMVNVNSNYRASSNWTLGETESEQTAYAILYDPELNVPIDTATFHATPELEGAVWSAYNRCDWATSYVFSFTLDLRGHGTNGIITISPSEVLYGYDYDGSALKCIYSGNYNLASHQLILDLAYYTTSDNHHFRTDRFTVTLTGNNATSTGVLTYDDGAGCPVVLDFVKISGSKTPAGSIQMNTPNSRTTGCTLYSNKK